MLENPITERRLVDQLLGGLRALPGVRVELKPTGPSGSRPDQYHDAEVRLKLAGKAVTVLIEVKKALFPRDVRQVLWRIKQISDARPEGAPAHNVVTMLVAESLSPGAKELLRDEQVGYFDSGGSLFLPARGVYLYVDRPPPKSLSRTVRSLFSGRRAQVSHSLLMQRGDWFSVTPLAAQARVSLATASQVLTALERFDWLESRGRGPRKERYLREPGALLDAWAKHFLAMRPPAMRRYYVTGVETDSLVEKIDAVFASRDVEYALTHEAAGQRYAPYLSRYSQVRCRILASPAADLAIGELGARTVDEGFNLAVIETGARGDLLFRERGNGCWLASPIHVYLDLLRSEGRAKEMANHLRREKIGF